MMISARNKSRDVARWCNKTSAERMAGRFPTYPHNRFLRKPQRTNTSSTLLEGGRTENKTMKLSKGLGPAAASRLLMKLCRPSWDKVDHTLITVSSTRDCRRRFSLRATSLGLRECASLLTVELSTIAGKTLQHRSKLSVRKTTLQE